MLEDKYLWKFLSISGKTYIIRIISSKKNMHFKNEGTFNNIVLIYYTGSG